MKKIDCKECDTAKEMSIATEFDIFKDVFINKNIIKQVWLKKSKIGLINSSILLLVSIYKYTFHTKCHHLEAVPPRGVPMKKYSEIMQQIYRRAPILKCGFIKVESYFIKITFQHRCFPVNFLHVFGTPVYINTFGWLLLTNTSGWILLENIDDDIKSKPDCLILYVETNDLANGTNLLNHAKEIVNQVKKVSQNTKLVFSVLWSVKTEKNIDKGFRVKSSLQELL